MNGLYNLENVVYQGIIFPKENIKKRKVYKRILSTTKKESEIINQRNFTSCCYI